MSRRIVLSCNGCGATGEGFLVPQGKIRNPEGWRYLSRDIDLCGSCSTDFQTWLAARVAAMATTSSGSNPAVTPAMVAALYGGQVTTTVNREPVPA